VNLSKLPIYGVRGMISGSSLLFDACLLPAVAVGALIGRTVMKRLGQRTFEGVVLTLTAAATVLLFLPRAAVSPPPRGGEPPASPAAAPPPARE
jgi:uncharacterized membrane protein YfcA